jgi:hypothetical protein
MANFVITKIADATTLGTFSNLKFAVTCLEKVANNVSYMPIYRKMRTLDNGKHIDIQGYRISKLLPNQVHNL